MNTLTITLDEPLRTLLEQTIEREVAQQVRDLLSQVIVPDVQYTCRQVAEHLALHPDTIRGYMHLPLGHPRRLPYVDCSDNQRGFRICSSDLVNWQKRNHCDTIANAGLAKMMKRQELLLARRSQNQKK